MLEKEPSYALNSIEVRLSIQILIPFKWDLGKEGYLFIFSD